MSKDKNNKSNSQTLFQILIVLVDQLSRQLYNSYAIHVNSLENKQSFKYSNHAIVFEISTRKYCLLQKPITYIH